MSNYGPPPPWPPPPPRPGTDWDHVVSVALLTVAWLVALGGCFVGLSVLVFLDYCPQASCSAGDAYTAVGGSIVVALLAAVAGRVAVGVRSSRRLLAWPFASATVVAVVVAVVVGGYGYVVAVGI